LIVDYFPTPDSAIVNKYAPLLRSHVMRRNRASREGGGSAYCRHGRVFGTPPKCRNSGRSEELSRGVGNIRSRLSMGTGKSSILLFNYITYSVPPKTPDSGELEPNTPIFLDLILCSPLAYSPRAISDSPGD
jgi:hypothetical protein